MARRRGWQRRWLLVGGLGAIAVVGAGVAVVLVVFRNRPRRSASARRSPSTAESIGRGDGLAAAAAGGYGDRTRGGQGLSLPGGDRSYPNRTTMTVTPSACGITVRWAAIVEHTEQYEECLGANGISTMASSSVTETFFGVQTRDSVTCSPGAYLRPAGTQIGATWTFTCSEPQEQWRGSGRLVGIEPVTVAHQRIVALHTRVVVNLAGRNTGDNPSDYWFRGRRLATARLARHRRRVAGHLSPLGSVRYHEQFDLTLADAAPAR